MKSRLEEMMETTKPFAIDHHAEDFTLRLHIFA